MKEIDLLGVYVSPFLRDLALAALAFAPLKLGLDRLRVERLFWHRPLLDVSLFVCLVAGASFGLRAVEGWTP